MIKNAFNLLGSLGTFRHIPNSYHMSVENVLQRNCKDPVMNLMQNQIIIYLWLQRRLPSVSVKKELHFTL